MTVLCTLIAGASWHGNGPTSSCTGQSRRILAGNMEIRSPVSILILLTSRRYLLTGILQW
jgi:hypothetical protein